MADFKCSKCKTLIAKVDDNGFQLSRDIRLTFDDKRTVFVICPDCGEKNQAWQALQDLAAKKQ